MRMNRIKPENEDTWHHCYNRVSGTALDRPLGPAEKEKFIRTLLHLSKFFCVQPVAFQVMSTHYQPSLVFFSRLSSAWTLAGA